MKIVVDKMPTKPSECFYAHNRRIDEESGHEYGICWIRGDGDWSSEVCALSFDKPCSYLTEAKEKPMPEQLRQLLLDQFHSTPTDAVPVIRCKDCKHWSDNDGIYTDADGVRFARCRIHNYETLNGLHEGWCPAENCYCSLGERKDNNNG